jgi:flagellar basal-body rod modification protein FlgD
MTTGVDSSTAAGAASSSSSNNAMSQLSGNFDTFLQLLTTQLQNQDPLDPMDTSQFTQQLVEYSQVEQQIDSNTNLQTLISQGTSASAAYATGYLGKTVTVSGGEGSLTNGQAQWTYNLGTAATSTTLQVTDANGNVVYSGSGQATAGNNNFNWNGEDNSGNQLPDGSYTLAVKASAGGQTVTTSVTAVGTVSEVNMINGTPQLLIGSMEVPLTSISSVQN